LGAVVVGVVYPICQNMKIIGHKNVADTPRMVVDPVDFCYFLSDHRQEKQCPEAQHIVT
jgi:hypothetical protein